MTHIHEPNKAIIITTPLPQIRIQPAFLRNHGRPSKSSPRQNPTRPSQRSRRPNLSHLLRRLPPRPIPRVPAQTSLRPHHRNRMSTTVASAQTGTTSVKCPWCTKPIISSLGAKQFIAIFMSYVKAAAEQAIAQLERGIAAVDLEFRDGNVELVAAAILLVVHGAYSKIPLAWFPLRILYWCIKLAVKHCQYRLGLLFIALGFCVGEFVHRDSGRSLTVVPC